MKDAGLFRHPEQNQYYDLLLQLRGRILVETLSEGSSSKLSQPLRPPRRRSEHCLGMRMNRQIAKVGALRPSIAFRSMAYPRNYGQPYLDYAKTTKFL